MPPPIVTLSLTEFPEFVRLVDFAVAIEVHAEETGDHVLSDFVQTLYADLREMRLP